MNKRIGKGKPKLGFRMTKRRKEALAKGYKLNAEGNAVDPKTGVVVLRFDGYKTNNVDLTPAKPVKKETDAQREVKISKRFRVLKTLASACVSGQARALIVSGPAGLSKSYTIEQILQKHDPAEKVWTIVKGYVRATGLYQLLYQHRFPGQVLVFDDADSIFTGSDAEVSINMLKAVLDTCERRRVSYHAQTELYDGSDKIPETFDFEGTCIFITNYDFDEQIAMDKKLSPHLAALQSRSHYIDLAMKDERDFLVRIRQVCKEDKMLRQQGLTAAEEKDVLDFLEKNYQRCRELSLRTALKLGALRKHDKNWRETAEVTCLHNQ